MEPLGQLQAWKHLPHGGTGRRRDRDHGVNYLFEKQTTFSFLLLLSFLPQPPTKYYTLSSLRASVCLQGRGVGITGTDFIRWSSPFLQHFNYKLPSTLPTEPSF